MVIYHLMMIIAGMQLRQSMRRNFQNRLIFLKNQLETWTKGE